MYQVADCECGPKSRRNKCSSSVGFSHGRAPLAHPPKLEDTPLEPPNLKPSALNPQHLTLSPKPSALILARLESPCCFQTKGEPFPKSSPFGRAPSTPPAPPPRCAQRIPAAAAKIGGNDLGFGVSHRLVAPLARDVAKRHWGGSIHKHIPRWHCCTHFRAKKEQFKPFKGLSP